MKKLTSIIAAALTLAACDAKEDPADQYRGAMPLAAAIQIGVPAASGSAGAQMVQSTGAYAAVAVAPEYLSEYARTSYWTAVTVNVGVWWTLEFVRFITRFPPTSCDDRSCTWGPWLGDDHLVYWKLHVEKVGGHFDYALSARSAADPLAPFVDLIAGTAFPGADRNHGSGSFVIDFDAQDQLPHPDGWTKEDHGQLSVEYDNNTGVHVAATFAGARNDDPDRLNHLMNAAYAFDGGTGTGGELQIAFEDVDTSETIALRTRWNALGAGRGDAHYTGPNPAAPPPTIDYFASECWAGEAAGWIKIFDTDPAYDAGIPCAFQRLDPTIVLPQ